MKFADIKFGFALVFALSLFTFIGCGKDDEPLVPNYNSSSGALAYEIKGIKDISMERVDNKKLQINVARLSGSKTTDVMLSATDLPDGLEAIFDIQKGAPDFTSFITFVATRVKEGTYTININGSGQGIEFKRYPMVVKILPYSNSSLGVRGDYTEKHQCSIDGERSFKVSVMDDKVTPNKVLIKGLWSGTYTHELTAILDPAAMTITIPEQQTFDVTFKGSGTYTDDQIIINYTVKTDIFEETCTAVLDRL